MVKDIELVMYSDHGVLMRMPSHNGGIVDADMDGLPDAWNDGATAIIRYVG